LKRVLARRPPGHHVWVSPGRARWFAAPVALLLFIFALRTLVLSAAALIDVLDVLGAEGALNLIGVGWLGSYLVLSGSPIAATSLTLLDAGVLNESEAFGQLVGSRIGASFIVLAVGFVYYLRGRGLPDSVHVGVVAFLVTATTWIPIALLGLVALEWGWFDGLEFGAVGPLTSLIDAIYDPVLEPLQDALPDGILFFGGVFLLLAALRLFDAALPTPEDTSDRLSKTPEWLHGRWSMFALGGGVTLATLSVAVSLTLLVPLALRGTIRRDAIVPYVLGANITTFADTLFAAAALESGATGTIVITTIIIASLVAVVVLALFYRPYVRAIHWATRRISQDRHSLAAFITAIVVVPLILTLI
jgi:sodium-dependent phosphate cotransporter